jgi:hypothetical protein
MPDEHGFSTITRLHRDDLGSLGFDVDLVDDQMMERIARKMENAYVENGFWIDLEAVANDLNIQKRFKN